VSVLARGAGCGAVLGSGFSFAFALLTHSLFRRLLRVLPLVEASALCADVTAG
jgi:hypothetical protein